VRGKGSIRRSPKEGKVVSPRDGSERYNSTRNGTCPTLLARGGDVSVAKDPSRGQHGKKVEERAQLGERGNERTKHEKDGKDRFLLSRGKGYHGRGVKAASGQGEGSSPEQKR